MTKVDENIQTAQNMLSGIVERCYELEEENKKLKEEVKQLKDKRIFNSDEYDLITLTSTTPQWELIRK